MKVLKWVGGNVPIDVLHELALQCHFDRRHYFSQISSGAFLHSGKSWQRVQFSVKGLQRRRGRFGMKYSVLHFEILS